MAQSDSTMTDRAASHPARIDLPVVVVVIARPSADAWDAFLRYEETVLPLLGRHGGTVERRLRARDAHLEVHVLSFPDPVRYAEFLNDQERATARTQLQGYDIEQQVFLVDEIGCDSVRKSQETDGETMSIDPRT